LVCRGRGLGGRGVHLGLPRRCREFSRFRFEGGAPIRNETVYQDIVPDRRIVFAYSMAVDDKRISVSLATVEIGPSGEGTRLVYTEQGGVLRRRRQT
jgi:uncharacterized protein YndB with AHSA1/START domain